MIQKFTFILLTVLLGWASAQSGKEKPAVVDKVTKSDAEWQQCLTPEEYKILREKGTEQAFTGKYYKHKEKGTYLCAACDTELFSSDTKFDSGTGWPSFYEALDKTKITFKEDNSLLMKRIEILCAKCDSHLGHVFDDGPNPTGKRYCVNSVSLDFEKAKE
jgi:peptide-methionine (R)-S-oxide reductase|tara:strand:+ start:114 stop:596 length:483 start_codon:yes stop_codon:yes gene_type:complete